MSYNFINDEELISLLKENDEAAFHTLYDRYWKDIFTTAYRKLKDKAVAEELTQNLFLSIWEKRRNLDIGNFKGWLFTAIRFSIINHYKSQIVHEKFVTHIKHHGETSSNDTEHAAIHRELSSAIEKGISLLPEKTQEVFKLSRIENRSVKEISSHLNISEKAVEYHITQSLKKMRFFLKDYIIYGIIIASYYI